MNILYYSCHHILEDDEVRLLKSMGHHVFVLGSNVNGKTSSPFRPAIECDARETVLNEIYCNMGGKYGEASKPEELIPDNFLCHFSLSIVMHDHRFITENWGNLRSKPLIWRTIGQGVDIYEDLLRPYRADGMHIVRYSPVENNIQNSLGQDAIIRFYKNDKEYCNWNGQDIKILTFANSLSSRYHTDSEEYRKIAEDMPFILGGTMNDDFRESLGFVSPERQRELYQNARAYLYFTGLSVPYTLNFIEAWMTGIPVIVYAPLERIGPYFEIDKLIVNGVNGFICRTIESARTVALELLADHALASQIGEQGRSDAINLFGVDHIRDKWQRLLGSLCPS